MPEKEKPIPLPDDPEQSKRFEEAARLLEVDESDKTFERALKSLAASKIASGLPRGKQKLTS